jgi:hypothetical protein
VAYLGIPVQRDATELAAYLLVHLLVPLVDANLLLAADVLHNIAVVRYAVMVELDKESAGKARAIGTARDPVCGHGTPSYLTLGTERAVGAFTEAAFTIDPFDGKVKAFGKCLEYAVGVLAVGVMPYAVQSTGPAVQATNTGQMFTYHSYSPSENVCEHAN